MVFARTHLRHGKREGAPAAAADHRQGARRAATNSASRTGVKNNSLLLVGRVGWGAGGFALSLTLALDLTTPTPTPPHKGEGKTNGRERYVASNSAQGHRRHRRWWLYCAPRRGRRYGSQNRHEHADDRRRLRRRR